VVAFYIFLLVPEYLLRFVAFIAHALVYRFKVRGDEHIPDQGAAILVCNHVSFVDAVLLMAASPRPIRFIMDHRIFACRCWAGCSSWPRRSRSRRRRKTRRPTRPPSSRPRQVLAEGDLLASSPKAASPATAAAASSRAAS
jgi:hypothetical protein